MCEDACAGSAQPPSPRHRGPVPGRFDLKQDKGGIIDIEFLVQYCVLAWSENQAALSVYTDNAEAGGVAVLAEQPERGAMPFADALTFVWAVTPGSYQTSSAIGLGSPVNSRRRASKGWATR